MAKGRKTGGRQKGTPNKDNQPLKEMILQALANAGGATYLTEQSTKNPTAFMTLVGRVLPLQVKDGGAEPTVPTVVNHHYETK
jgi:hypothetical protein